MHVSKPMISKGLIPSRSVATHASMFCSCLSYWYNYGMNLTHAPLEYYTLLTYWNHYMEFVKVVAKDTINNSLSNPIGNKRKRSIFYEMCSSRFGLVVALTLCEDSRVSPTLSREEFDCTTSGCEAML